MVGAVRTFNGSEEEEWVEELLDSSVRKLCVPLKVRALPTLVSFTCEAYILPRRFEFCRLYERKRAAFYHTRLPIFCSTTCSPCNGRSGTSLRFPRHSRSKHFLIVRSVDSRPCSRITEVSYKVFFDSIEAQGRALHRIPLVCHLLCLLRTFTHAHMDTSHRTSTTHLFLLRIQSSITHNSCVKLCRSMILPFSARGPLIPLRRARDSDASWISWWILLLLCVLPLPRKKPGCVRDGIVRYLY